ncbi:hypothetical protein TPHA_0K01730 [Tetrapisispora phaffii CBS 4417]|uniref:Glycoside hydrolase family 17 protein n=1 Tax=Tetrapisispora phaffii (strain ATCC 24235 / CBS 4417 / NBRC 1672 / NRRL Y-8282 / UCD 70-5) TaxID=1071381 RepID=G8BZH8_TETPH|nr:hypothetical protein TPHA_0K01730 [Tetrapisispora phaffii CBS 4417]CCE65306.1 hypothetical protein TPHA_0K01730 [Tetrapisispora phaffii CBS 4417]
MYTQSFIQYIITSILIASFASAFPVLDKRLILTRVHTASTTNTVTDFYSTTTEVVVAPTVKYIISGDSTSTTTLFPSNAASTAAPVTITTFIQKDVNAETTSSATSAAQSTVSALNQDNFAAQSSSKATTTLSPASTAITQAEETTSTSIAVAATSSSSSSSSSSLVGAPQAIVYSPYNDDGSCKDADTVKTDLNFIASKGIFQIRVYATDCNSLETVEPVCKDLGIKINQGLWISSAGVDSIDDSLSSLIAYGQSNNWDVIEYITIGNEAVNSGYCSVSDLIAKIASVKSQLQAAGYSGQVTTSEPPVTFINSPELCTSSDIDFVGINPHSYFDANSNAASAGSFVKGQYDLTVAACGSKNVVITETGFPSAGNQNGGNIPSKANQLIAVQSILDEMNKQVTILSTYNDFWKDPGSYGIEQYFGISDLLVDA